MLLYPASIQTNKKIKLTALMWLKMWNCFVHPSSGGIFENEDDAGDFFRLHPVKKGPTRIVEKSRKMKIRPIESWFIAC